MNSESERPRTSSRDWVRTASVETQASKQAGQVAIGELITEACDHSQREGAIRPFVLKLVAGVAAGQAAQRHRPRHETKIGVRFAGPDKLIHLVEAGEVVQRLGRGFADLFHRTA